MWEPTNKVSAEDVRHIRNRVEEFRFTHVFTTLKEVESCAICLARWVIKYSSEAATLAVPVVALSGSPAVLPDKSVQGFVEAMAFVKLTGPIVDMLFSDVQPVGAVHVDELTLHD